jgi:hypothetical protein
MVAGGLITLYEALWSDSCDVENKGSAPLYMMMTLANEPPKILTLLTKRKNTRLMVPFRKKPQQISHALAAVVYFAPECSLRLSCQSCRPAVNSNLSVFL